MGKVIVVNVHCLDGVTCVTDSHFFHKDSGCQLVISGLNLETGTQVHFSLTEKSGKPVSMIGVSDNGILSVDVPDNVLNSNTKRNDYDIYAFVYCTDENSGWTEHEIVIPVKMRPDKEFENPTSEELTAFDKVAKYVSDTAESIADDREQINKNKEDIEYLKEHGAGGGDSEDYKLPQATETNLGGVKASPKTDNDTVEARIGADGKLYVPTYPEQNKITVDDKLDKTSTNPVQNKAVAEAVEKLSNNKLEKTELPEAVNTALTQAKENGEFDGKDGQNGKDGEDGKDGVSVTHKWKGTVLEITSASGTDSADLKGEKGDKGDAFTYEDFTEEQLATLKGEPGKDGQNGKDGSDGQDGEDGADGITPHIGNNGNWFIGTTDTGNPSRGDKGDTGEQGPQGIQGEKGVTGADGTTPHIGANGNWFIGDEDTGVNAEGKDGKTPEKGIDYFDGKTPVKGTDYFTEADKTAFVEDVLNALPTWEGGAY